MNIIQSRNARVELIEDYARSSAGVIGNQAQAFITVEGSSVYPTVTSLNVELEYDSGGTKVALFKPYRDKKGQVKPVTLRGKFDSAAILGSVEGVLGDVALVVATGYVYTEAMQVPPVRNIRVVMEVRQ